MTHDELVEAVARNLARENGDDFDAIPADKQEWIAQRGQFGGRFRDVNEMKQNDYLCLANSALSVILDALAKPDEAMLEAMNKALRKYIQSVPQSERKARWGKPTQRRGYKIPDNEKHAARLAAALAASPLAKGTTE